MATMKHDGVLLEILKEESHLIPFLDAMFGFLYRCTDFYQIQNHPNEKLGFPPGVAEDIVNKMFKKWEMRAREDRTFFEEQRAATSDIVPPVIQEVEVMTESEDFCERSEPEKDDEEKPSATGSNEEACENKSDQKRFQNSDSSYNGAIRDGYQWSQSISDLDVQITVPPHIMKAREVQVDVSSNHISVSALTEDCRDEWFSLIDRELSYKTNKEESVWSLVPGKHIQLHLEKTQERWWESLFTDEPKIDLKNIDASRPMDDLSQEEQMKIQELIWNQERKRQGLPTSDNMALEKILKDSWNKDGSPFKGRPYDPKDIRFGIDHLSIPDSDGNT